MPAIAFDRFYRYAELTEVLHAFAREHPQLVTIESIGQSHEGRDIWVLTVTNTRRARRPRSRRSGSTATSTRPRSRLGGRAVFPRHRWSRDYGRDPDVTRALDTRAFYVCPRINPDGAEWALADKPKWVRSSTRPYPFDEEEIEGLHVEDIDGDGRILQMRIPDPNGLWKPHPGRAAAPDPPRPDRDRRHVLPRDPRGPLRATGTASR